MLNTLNKQYKPIFDFLNKWEDDFHLYDLVVFHSMEFYPLTEEPNILKDYYDVDLSEYFDDQFISFAVDGGGGYYSFWLYPDLVGEPPIVFLGSEGETRLLANNLNDLVNRLVNEFTLDEYQKSDKISDYMLNELLCSYEETYKKASSEEEVLKLFEEDRYLFKQQATELTTLKAHPKNIQDSSDHPSFDEWISQVEAKNEKMYKPPIATIEELEQYMASIEKLMDSDFPNITKEMIEVTFKKNYPEFYESDTFKKWVEKITSKK